MSKEETIYYLETADGEMMRVPESGLKEFQALNRKIKAKMQQNAKASQKNFLNKEKPKK